MTVEDKILKTVGTRLKDAVNWSNSNIAQKQEQALKYYKRDYLPGDAALKGRSKWVSPEVQQRIDWMTAQLIRIFSTPENVCEFLPFGPEDEPVARSMTQTVNWILKTKNSHLSYLHPWIQNGLLTGLGIVTVEFETEMQESLPRLIKGIPDEQLPNFHAQEEAGQIVIEEASKPYPGQMGMVRDLKVRTIRKTPVFNVLSVAPEDFVLSKDAKFDAATGGIAAKVQGHRKFVGKQALIEMGFDADKVKTIPLATDKTDGIAMVRSRDNGSEQGISGDDVEVYTIFTRLNLDGKTRPYRLTLAGDLDRPTLLDHEETTAYAPYAPFVPFPIADQIFGLGIADKIGDDHTLITKMTRAMLDSLHMAVHPIKIANPDATNLDDLLNVAPGSVIRSTDPTGGISYNTPPFAGGQALPVIENISQSLDLSTGVGAGLMSLDASDLQRTTASATNQRTNASQLLVEMVSRFFAETGYRYLTKIIIDQLIQKPDEAQALVSRLTNQFVPLDEFTPEYDVTTSVAFGVLTRDQSTQSLMNILAQQQQLAAAGSPLVTPQHMYATLAKLTETAGFKNTGAFFVDPSTLPPQPPPPPPPDPNAGLIQVETVKAQLKAQSDEADRQFQLAKLSAEMDLKRDGMAQEFALKNAEIQARYAAQVDVARLKAEQDIPRDPLGNPVPPQPIAPMQPPVQQPVQPPIAPNMGMPA